MVAEDETIIRLDLVEMLRRAGRMAVEVFNWFTKKGALKFESS